MEGDLARIGVDEMKCKNGHDVERTPSIPNYDTAMFQLFMNGVMNGTIIVIDGDAFCGRCIRERWLEFAEMPK